MLVKGWMINVNSMRSLKLEPLSETGAALGFATGFAVETPNGPHLITNRHVVAGRNNNTHKHLHTSGALPHSLRIHHHSAANGWCLREEALLVDHTPRWKEHPGLGERADLAALPLSQLEGVQLHCHDVQAKSKMNVGPTAVVSVIGFPFGETAGGTSDDGSGSLAIWATGFVASEPDVDYQGLPTFLIDCRSREGQSGSPVIAYRAEGGMRLEEGKLVSYMDDRCLFMGVYSGRINSESDIGIVWKRSALIELIEAC